MSFIDLLLSVSGALQPGHVSVNICSHWLATPKTCRYRVTQTVLIVCRHLSSALVDEVRRPTSDAKASLDQLGRDWCFSNLIGIRQPISQRTRYAASTQGWMCCLPLLDKQAASVSLVERQHQIWSFGLQFAPYLICRALIESSPYIPCCLYTG